jgi:SAM-dependent methyltransferase
MLYSEYLQEQIIAHLLPEKQELQWLIEQNVRRADKVADFGCGGGEKTLALMWALGASEAVGIDIEDITPAQSMLEGIRHEITIIRSKLRSCRDIPEDDLMWWNGVPDFLKRLPPEECIKFCQRDITKPTGLQPDCYDIAFCHRVLHHIWFDQTQEDTQFAVREMARVAKPGGLVAAFEVIQYSDKPKLDFRPLFEQAGLERVHTKETEENYSQGQRIVAEYLYKKQK